MSSNPDETFRAATEGGFAAADRVNAEVWARVGPATENQANTFRARLIPFGCWKVDHIRFEGGSSFIRPEIVKELAALKQLRAIHSGAVLSVFGHADRGLRGKPPGRPRRYKLVIRGTDSIWPAKMAEICTHDANRYRELEAVAENQILLAAPGQWRDLHAGDEIHVPAGWEQEQGWPTLRGKYDIQESVPVGDTQSTEPPAGEAFAKAVSGRRAAAVYALLTRRTEIWEDLYSNSGRFASVVSEDEWGTVALRTMLATLARGEAPDGYKQSASRRSELFRAYMDKLCGAEVERYRLVIRPEDSIWPTKLAEICTGDANRYRDLEKIEENRKFLRPTGQWRDLHVGDEIFLPSSWKQPQRQLARERRLLIEPNESADSGNNAESAGLELAKEDFLARGDDPYGKGDYQGCGAFNPLVVSNSSEADAGDGQHEAAEANRRVVILLFRPGSRVHTDHWPCPRVTEGPAGCHRRFWSAAGNRSISSPAPHPADPRPIGEFSCRFYDRL